jgi:hypothetical protein
MPKFMVEIIASYPCVIEAQTIEEAFTIAEETPWDEWPDDNCEIVEYCAELIIEDNEDNQVAVQQVPAKQRPKLTLVKDN